jgi:ferredoxin-NADP reductase
VALLTLPIRDVRVETPRTRSVFVSLSGAVVDYCAGQAVWVGGHGQRLRKPYSIACAPEQARIQDALELLIQVGADGSAGPHLDPPAAGMLVDVDGPTGTFCFPDHPREPRFLFIAGGTGIAPLRAMLWHALWAFPDRELALFYSARSADGFAYGDELRQLARAERLVLRETVTREAGPPWTGARGRLTPARIAAMLTPEPTRCFVCGPPAFAEDVTSWLRHLGVAEERVLAEGW